MLKLLDQVLNILECISMEKIELALPKDARQVAEELGVYFLYLLL